MRKVLAISLLIVTACNAGQSRQSEDAPGIGDEAVDGQFTFVVESFECGETEVVNGIFRQEANGVFCLLELDVSNSGEEGRTFLAGAQGLFAQGGGRLAPSNEATRVLNPDVMSEEINPGLSIQATIVFDIDDPDDVELAHLKDAPLSGGVRVRLAP